MKRCTLVFVSLAMLGSVCSAHGSVSFYVSNPTSNSTDWTIAVLGLGGVVNTNVNFDTHPVGTLNNTFYSVSDGVTISTTGSFNTVQFGAGPGQGNTFSPPLSPGEGLHAVSNYLFASATDSTLTISFDEGVFGAGLFVIDLFNPNSANSVSIEAFTGPDGTGTSLGSAVAPAYNFQPNHLLYLGAVSTAGDIGSLRLTDHGTSADEIGVDDIRFATGPAGTVPEPATIIIWSLLGAASWLGMRVARRGRQVGGRRAWSPEDRQAILEIVARR
jgi:hypothetical protein